MEGFYTKEREIVNAIRLDTQEYENAPMSERRRRILGRRIAGMKVELKELRKKKREEDRLKAQIESDIRIVPSKPTLQNKKYNSLSFVKTTTDPAKHHFPFEYPLDE